MAPIARWIGTGVSGHAFIADVSSGERFSTNTKKSTKKSAGCS